MYSKDKSHRITLRLNESQFEYVRKNAEILDTSPSDFLRMVINASMSLSQKASSYKVERTGDGRENDTAYIDNIV